MLSNIRSFFFQNRGNRQTLAKNIFWLSIGQIGSRIVRSVVIIYAARVLGAEEYGIFSYVLGLAGFFTVFADLGINSILTRETAKKPSESSSYFITSLWIKIGLLIGTALLIIFAAPHLSGIEAAKVVIPLVALLTIFDGVRELISSYFRGKEKMELEAFLISATNIAITIFGFLILRTNPTAQALALTYALAAGAGTAIGVVLARKELLGFFHFFKKDIVIPILKSALPLSLVTIIGLLMLQVDILMLGYFKQAYEVGLYSAGQRIVQFLYIFPTILANGIFPLFAKSVLEKDREYARMLIERMLAFSFLLTLPIAVGGVILGGQIIGLIYGTEYLPGVLAFQILMLTVPIISMGTITGNYILAYDRQKQLAPNTVLGAVTNIVLNFFLIPLYGIVGASLATFSAQLFYNALNWNFAKKTNYFLVLKKIARIFGAVTVMAIATYLMKSLGIFVIYNVIISGIIYATTLFTLREKTIHEIRLIFKK